jgi:hypothetical protein
MPATERFAMETAGRDTSRIREGVDNVPGVLDEALSRLDGIINMRVENKQSAPPGSPTQGNAYIVAASATGDWSDITEDQVALYARDSMGNNEWVFINPWNGMLVWNENDGQYQRYSTSGGWVQAFLNRPLLPYTTSSLLNTPPGTPNSEVVYRIAASPTGDWVGHAHQLAIWDGNGWIYIPAQNGQSLMYTDGTNYFITWRISNSLWHVVKVKTIAPSALTGSETLAQVITKVNQIRTALITNGIWQ